MNSHSVVGALENQKCFWTIKWPMEKFDERPNGFTMLKFNVIVLHMDDEVQKYILSHQVSI